MVTCDAACLAKCRLLRETFEPELLTSQSRLVTHAMNNPTVEVSMHCMPAKYACVSVLLAYFPWHCCRKSKTCIEHWCVSDCTKMCT